MTFPHIVPPQPVQVAELFREEISKRAAGDLKHVPTRVFADDDNSDADDSGLESILYHND